MLGGCKVQRGRIWQSGRTCFIPASGSAAFHAVNNIHVYSENITPLPIFQFRHFTLKWASLFVLLLAPFLVQSALAQETDSTESRIKITLQDGSELIGQVVAETNSTLEFRTTSAAFSDEGVFTEQPVFVAGGEYQVSDHVKFLSENYVFMGEGSNVLFSGGIRFFGDNLAAGLSFISFSNLLSDAEGFPLFPS